MSAVMANRVEGWDLDQLQALIDQPPDNWIADAACRGMDTDIFFPHRGDETGLAQAKRVCASCPVQAACLAEEIVDGGSAEGGVRGGTTARTRRQLRARLATPRKRPGPRPGAPRSTPGGH